MCWGLSETEQSTNMMTYLLSHHVAPSPPIFQTWRYLWSTGAMIVSQTTGSWFDCGLPLCAGAGHEPEDGGHPEDPGGAL